MATYTRTGSGGAKLGGCADILLVNSIAIAYPKRSVVYSRDAANKGYLERITIKDWIINESNVIYKDTLNSHWNPSDLVTHSQAISLAISALQTELQRLNSYINNLCSE